MSNKYPYIPKEYYAAVMFACKIIRETHYFNKAIKTAANYYHVDADELERHVRARQAAGQQGAFKGRKYNYYLVFKWIETERDPIPSVEKISVVKATSSENAITQFSEADEREERANYTGGVDSWIVGHSLVGLVYKTSYQSENEARAALGMVKAELAELIDQGKLDQDNIYGWLTQWRMGA